MTKYKVTLDSAANGESGLSEVWVDAVGVHTNGDWLVFNSGTAATSNTVVAAFPSSRVISMVTV